MTKSQLLARAAAYEAAAHHIGNAGWTKNETELAQGEEISKLMERLAAAIRENADRLADVVPNA